MYYRLQINCKNLCRLNTDVFSDVSSGRVGDRGSPGSCAQLAGLSPTFPLWRSSWTISNTWQASSSVQIMKMSIFAVWFVCAEAEFCSYPSAAKAFKAKQAWWFLFIFIYKCFSLQKFDICNNVINLLTANVLIQKTFRNDRKYISTLFVLLWPCSVVHRCCASFLSVTRLTVTEVNGFMLKIKHNTTVRSH